MGYAGAPGLEVELDGAVLRLTIDNPTRRNALDDVSVGALLQAVEAASQDDDVRVISLDSTGGDFCSGFDIVARNAPTPDAKADRPRVGSIQRRLPNQAHRLVPMLLEVQVPVIATVRGWAAGLGFQLAVAAEHGDRARPPPSPHQRGVRDGAVVPLPRLRRGPQSVQGETGSRLPGKVT